MRICMEVSRECNHAFRTPRNPSPHYPASRRTPSRPGSTAKRHGRCSGTSDSTAILAHHPQTPNLPGVGEAAANSNLFATFNAAFPGQAIWQNRIRDALNRWGELTGITYVLEPNDDGAAMFGTSGVVGVRGDIRICGKFIDGGGNTLAYNFFPGLGGDMVLDTGIRARRRCAATRASQGTDAPSRAQQRSSAAP